ncbi:MAG: S8 family serine peptidase [Candidatus Dormibacteria bacterium]
MTRRIGYSAALLVFASPLLASAAAATPPGPAESVIVGYTGPAHAEASGAVLAAGGTVIDDWPALGELRAQVPAGELTRLEAAAGVGFAVPDATARLLGDSGSDQPAGYDPSADVNSVYNTTLKIGAQALWQAGITGAGVDVALVDSGVAPVPGLQGEDKVIDGPDLSFESQLQDLAHLDTYGHGTHMAGLIAGRDAGAAAPYTGNPQVFAGVAPDARLVSLKVAANNGAADVSQVLAAIDWVIEHRTSNGLHIRVMNLSFGTASSQDYRVDPLAYAAEAAWRAGIVVVAAAGNAGSQAPQLVDPAYDPYLLAVGAVDSVSATDYSGDYPAAFSSAGSATRPADLGAPGMHLASLRDPGSYIDQRFGSQARAGDRYFRGSGTSQAAAVTSGAAALLLQLHPAMTPDQVKALLTASARPLPQGNQAARTELDLRGAAQMPVANVTQAFPVSSGAGRLELSRGGVHLAIDGKALNGERDIFGAAVDTRALASAVASGTAWNRGRFNGNTWTGSRLQDSTWQTATWSALSWARVKWSDLLSPESDGNEWTGNEWTGNEWTGNEWTGNEWTGNEWTDGVWSCASWS